MIYLFTFYIWNSWIPDAIVFNSYQNYGTPSYWLQQFFIDSNGATFLNSTLHNSSSSIVASAIQYKNSQDGKNYLKVKVKQHKFLSRINIDLKYLIIN